MDKLDKIKVCGRPVLTSVSCFVETTSPKNPDVPPEVGNVRPCMFFFTVRGVKKAGLKKWGFLDGGFLGGSKFMSFFCVIPI